MSIPPTVSLYDPTALIEVGSVPETLETVDPPPRIGRFLVTGVLGTGGMGTVLLGHDSVLRRQVAIKVLHSEVSGGYDRRQSLRREARALARLSHPNVVQVYEVGEFEGRLYVAMERVVGQTFTRWHAARPRHFEEIRDILVSAGRALEAAHARGLLHRDFKPDNILVGDDGRPRVVDFGLVHRLPYSRQAPMTFASLGPPSTGGRQAGTVPYMAPEQLIGQERLDARADQFAFCVTLYEAVYDRHPFSAPGVMETGLRIIAGEPEPPPPTPNVPAWLPAVLMRGLSLRPEDRFADMGALLDALTPPVRARRPSPSRVVGGVALALMGAGVVSSMTAPDPIEPCAQPGRMLAGTWDHARRVELQQRILDSGIDHPQDTWLRVRDHLDVYATHWRRAAGQLCEAGRARAEDDPQQHAHQQCVDAGLRELRHLVDELGRADDAVLERAIDSAMLLPDVDDCLGPASAPAVTATRSLTDAQQAEVAEIRAAIAAAELDRELGRPLRALEQLEGLTERARALHQPALRAEVLYAVGKAQVEAEQLVEAEHTLAEAFWLAQATGLPEQAARAGILLIYIVGDRQRRFEDGMAWARHTQALIDREGLGGRVQARALNNRGAFELLEPAVGPDHPELSILRAELDDILRARTEDEGATTPPAVAP